MSHPEEDDRSVHALPVQLTTLVGREREVASVRELLTRSRLLTLTGAGGSGKTRVALEAARQHLLHEAGIVAWVELASVQDAAAIGLHVARALGVGDESSRPIMDTLVSVIANRLVLVVLDNCEHLIDGCAHFVDTLLRVAPTVRVLATSREALGIGGERSWLLPVLTLPPSSVLPMGAEQMDDVRSSEAAQLFVQRARDVQPSFTLTEGNAGAIATICRQLDGLPLAIELAAARVRVLAPEQIAARLDDAFRVLGSGRRSALPRHRTLREAIGWSVRLLDEGEARLLSRLSVFAGEFPLERAESVCSDDTLPADVILDTLSALVDKSLVAMREANGGARYRLLETIRQFAAEQLMSAGVHTEWHARHAVAYRDVIAALEPAFTTRARAHAVSSLVPEVEDVRAALRWSYVNAPALHVRIAGMLPWFWYSIGAWSEGRRLLEAALALPDASAPDRDRAALLFGAGAIAALQADNFVAQGWLRECAEIAQAVHEPALHAYARNYLSMALAAEGKGGEQRETELHARAALEWFQRTGDLYGHRLALLLLATGSLTGNDLPAAHAHAADAVRVARLFGVDRELGIALQVHGTILLMMGELDASERLMQEALTAFRRDPQPLFMARAVDVLAVIAVRRGDAARGVRFTGAASAERELIGAALFTPDHDRLAPHLAAARERVGDAEFDVLWAAGRSTRLASVIDDVLKEAAGRPHEPLRESPPRESSHDDSREAVPSTEGERALVMEASAEVPHRGLVVHALGRLRVSCDGAVIAADRWRSARPRELLVLLLLHPQGRSREQIGLAFWPDVSPAQVKNNFHVTLHHLRKTLGASDWIVFESERYRVNAERGVQFDAIELEHGLRAAMTQLKAAMRTRGPVPLTVQNLDALHRTLALYAGDLLADEAAGDWHLAPRDALRRAYSDVLELAGALFDQTGDHERAADVYRRLVAVEPLDEQGCRALMAALARSGARTEALRQYERLAARLSSELETTPDAGTRQLRDRIARGELTAL